MSLGESFILFSVTPLLAVLGYLVLLSKRLQQESLERHRTEFEETIRNRLHATEALGDTEGESIAPPVRQS